MAGFIGVCRASMMMTVNPNNMIGMEMDVIAACVLGGVSLVGGEKVPSSARCLVLL